MPSTRHEAVQATKLTGFAKGVEPPHWQRNTYYCILPFPSASVPERKQYLFQLPPAGGDPNRNPSRAGEEGTEEVLVGRARESGTSPVLPHRRSEVVAGLMPQRGSGAPLVTRRLPGHTHIDMHT